ncbi:hypothetical protein PTSG_06971 [Salpingoeca rosetta]|uniref:WW domain-containing protein n=1 Tax=Salpingoeca rosetta (strain ATCC 50818 / BSB-021) TaxID=946362 RepID=F2UFC1_SALR5|nr:uncharacterized protein PTSG_06971 [Salpingoeca rosetta]EGD75321.1 hypothetical protein PTSG_06971 [Salpingoeca rosetta]|eukprot:XP_004992374.1 hypothetical protein PTSG_06971 [Salpingoeca rosetta]
MSGSSEAVLGAESEELESQLLELERRVASRQHGTVKEMAETVGAMRRVLTSARTALSSQRQAIASWKKRAEHSEHLVVALKAHVRRLQQENANLQGLVDNLSGGDDNKGGGLSRRSSVASTAAPTTAPPSPRPVAGRAAVDQAALEEAEAEAARLRREVAHLKARMADQQHQYQQQQQQNQGAPIFLGGTPVAGKEHGPATSKGLDRADVWMTPAHKREEQERVNRVLRRVLDQRDEALQLLESAGIATDGIMGGAGGRGGRGHKGKGASSSAQRIAREKAKEARRLRHMVAQQQEAIFMLEEQLQDALTAAWQHQHGVGGLGGAGRVGSAVDPFQQRRGRSITSIYQWAARNASQRSTQYSSRATLVPRAIVATPDVEASAVLLKGKQLEVDLLRAICTGLRDAVQDALAIMARDSSNPVYVRLQQAMAEYQSPDLEGAPYGWERRRTDAGLEFYVDRTHQVTLWWHPLLEVEVGGADVYAPYDAPHTAALVDAVPPDGDGDGDGGKHIVVHWDGANVKQPDSGMHGRGRSGSRHTHTQEESTRRTNSGRAKNKKQTNSSSK